MKIDLTSVLNGEINQMNIDCDISPENAPEDITLLPGAHITGVIRNSAGYIRLTSTVTVPYKAQCARCLGPVEDTLEFGFDRTLVTKGAVPDEELEEQPDEYLVIDKGFVNPDCEISESVFLEFPMLLLCSDDCGGLCQNCGRKLASGETCNCKPREIDPRLAKLRDLYGGTGTDRND